MDVLERYKYAPVDHSPAFSALVTRLGDAIAARLNTTVGYARDMNYAAGQQIVVYLLPSLSVASGEADAGYALRVCVSARAPLWTLLLCTRAGPHTWEFTDPSRILSTPETAAVLAGVRAVLNETGRTEISPDLLEQPVQGKETDLDGAPATVRDVFFCEIC